jgi:hypothetical protein
MVPLIETKDPGIEISLGEIKMNLIAIFIL